MTSPYTYYGEPNERPADRLFPLARDAGVCPSCGCLPDVFTDALSEREFEISGLCQECQDKIFTEDE